MTSDDFDVWTHERHAVVIWSPFRGVVSDIPLRGRSGNGILVARAGFPDKCSVTLLDLAVLTPLTFDEGTIRGYNLKTCITTSGSQIAYGSTGRLVPAPANSDLLGWPSVSRNKHWAVNCKIGT